MEEAAEVDSVRAEDTRRTAWQLKAVAEPIDGPVHVSAVRTKQDRLQLHCVIVSKQMQGIHPVTLSKIFCNLNLLPPGRQISSGSLHYNARLGV